ncbi:MAG: hypothetical protein WEG36_07195 [Gemmatimonadota bacterium]
MRIRLPRRLRDERGMALAFAVLLLLVVSAMAAGALAVTSSSVLVNRMYERGSALERGAEQGIEVARALVNADPDLYPAEGFAVIEQEAAVLDGEGTPIPGVSRWTYVGPSGILSGQYGIFGTAVSVVRDAGRGVAIRRSQLFQESFARFAYFTDIEPSNIYFGGGDQIFGPVHSNDRIKIHSTGATFHSEVRTAEDVTGEEYGDFRQGFVEGVQAIPLPETQELETLRGQAQEGGTHFVAPGNPANGATLRIEFMAVDLNNDGATTGANEGFIRVYQSNDVTWLMARAPANGLRNSDNCGHFHPNGIFIPASAHPDNGPDSWVASLTNNQRRCFLGGTDALFGGFVANDGDGAWLQWGGAVSPLVQGRPDGSYLIPITRALNPNFKGVIFVDGNVVLSGTLRGRVTLAATGDIYFGDDLVYATDPGAGTCVDILGLFGGEEVVVADNTLNSPQQPAPGNNWVNYDDTEDEYFHAVILALDKFTVENFNAGARTTSPCGNTLWGRGCLYVTGGIIQATRGAVGQTSNPGGYGYIKRYAYDLCAAMEPPPYFPTTGHFYKGALYQVDPAGFDIDDFFDQIGS